MRNAYRASRKAWQQQRANDRRTRHADKLAWLMGVMWLPIHGNRDGEY